MTTSEIPQTQPARKKALGLPVDTMLLVVVGALIAFGLMMVYSSTFDWAYRAEGDPAYFFMRQVLWLGLGLVMMAIAARMDYHWWRRLAVLMMLVTLVLLVAVLIFGSPVFGALRSLFNGSVQPSELAKLVTLIYLSVWLSSKGDKIRQLGYGIVPYAIIVGLIAGLILLQPDLSAAGTILVLALAMFVVAGADLWQIIVLLIVALAGAAAVIPFSAHGRQRLIDYVTGLQDITQATWHIQQAGIAFVNGGLFGRGLGESQQKFGFLPTPHTDSIFAIVGEELGLVGCLVVVALFAALLWRGFKIASQARDTLGALLASGIVCWVGVEALINISAILGALPFAGNALPFISYGGSNLVMMLTAMGVLLNISWRRDAEALPRRTRAAGHYAGRPAAETQRTSSATFGFSRRDRRGRVPRLVSRSDADR